MELLEFRKEFLDQVYNDGLIGTISSTSSFIEKYSSYLIESEEIVDFEIQDIEFVGYKQKRVKIDGYCYDDIEKSFSLFIANFSNADDLQNITVTAADKEFSKMESFIENTMNGYIFKNCEQSSQIYQLAELLKEKYKFIRKFKLYIFSDNQISKKLRNLEDSIFEDKIIEKNVWDIQRIYDLVLSGMQKEEIEIDLSKFDCKGIKFIKAISSEEENYDSYLAVINGELLANIYLKYGARLLEGNVRSFLSIKGKINKEIRNTILNRPQIFFAYNNGIAATATDVLIKEMDGEYLITNITDFQIINGGQTTASIANAVIQDKAKVSDVMIPLKLSVVNRLKAEEMIPNIARYANSQNKVDEADFFSNSPFHRRFEDLSRRILAPAVNGNQFSTIWFYERARGQYVQEQMKCTASQKKTFVDKHPKKQVIKKTDLAKYMVSYYGEPHLVSKGNQYNMAYFANKIETDWNRDDAIFSDYFYKKSIALAIMFKSVETLVSNEDWYKKIKAYRANIVTYSIARLFYYVEKEKLKSVDFIKIWNDQSLDAILIEQFKVLTYEMYRFITEGEKETANITEWCKKEKCWGMCKITKFSFTGNFTSSLIDKEQEKSVEIESRRSQKDTNAINCMVTVIELGDDYWKNVLQWGLENKMINETYLSLLKLASNMIRTKKFPTEKQSSLLLKIKKEFEENGMVKV
ncbi:MAG: AIPR family protein [Erysipelotrichaceae bacterium]|uniref:AIPR family protein n=1 Tax=Anaerorhabdus sp. TaxID=1872524 RepID=UPI002FC64774